MRPLDTHAGAGTPEAPIERSRRRFFVPALQRSRLPGQAIRFGVVGVLNTAVDFGILNLLLLVPGMPHVAAKAVSYSAGIVNSFFWNKYWTFSAARSSRGAREFLIFLAVNSLPLTVNVVVFYGLGLWVGQGSRTLINLEGLAAAILAIVWNFLGSRYLAFRHTALRKDI